MLISKTQQRFSGEMIKIYGILKDAHDDSEGIGWECEGGFETVRSISVPSIAVCAHLS